MPVTLKSRLPVIAAELTPETLAALKEQAEKIAEDAKGRVPVMSGALRDAIHVEEIDGGVSIVAGDTNAFYGHIVENGSVKTAPRPFLVPAFEAGRADIEEAIGEKLGDL